MTNVSRDYNSLIDRYYPAGSRLRDIYLHHCRSVASMALEIAQRKHLPLDPYDVEASAMLHDIGIFATNAPSIECRGNQPYICHGVIGARLIREAGLPDEYAGVAEHHTGSGLTRDDVISANMPLEPKDYLPLTLLERLICYADKFYSKSGDMERKSLERVRRSMARFSEESLRRFDSLHSEFA